MARLTFPDEGSRSAFRTAPSGRPLTSAAGAAALVYLDAGATTLADIQTTAGAAITGSSVNLDAYSRFPLFLGPTDGTDTLYVVVDGGPVSPMYARVDDRIDAVKATADAAETPAGAQAKATAAQAAAVQRANHTGTQSADTLTDGTTNKAFLATERTKLSGVATGATANSADATLLARANHTGTQLAATVSDFSTAVVTAASGAYRPLPGAISALTTGSVVAHRNAGLLYPEGTMEGMRLAAAIPGVMPDIGDFYLTADGVPVSTHDSTVDRLTSLSGNVSDFTISGLLRAPIVDTSTWFGGGWGGPYDLVTADRMLATFGGDKPITFEAKDVATAQVVAGMISSRGIGRSCLVSAASAAILAPALAAGAVGCIYYAVADVAATTAAAIVATCAANGLTHVQIQHGSDMTKIAALIASGLKVWIYDIYRHWEVALYAGMGIFGWFCDDPLYTPNQATPSKYRRSYTSWWQSGTWGPGHLDNTGDTSIIKRGSFVGTAGAYRWQPSNDNYALLGEISPVANPSGSYTITVPITFDALGSDATRWAGFFFASPDDYHYVDGVTDARRNGYNVIARANGTVNLYKVTGGATFLGLASANTAPVAGSTTTLTIAVTPTSITITRNDGGPQITTSDATWRGGYMHAGATGYTASVSRFSFGKIAVA